MGFLDTIGQRGSESRPYGSRPAVDQPQTWDDSDRDIQPAQEPRSNRIHAAAIWSAALIIVAAVAVAAWLGVRNFATVVAPHTETSAEEAPPAAQTPAEKPRPTRRPVRPRTAVRSAENRVSPIETAASTERAEAASEGSVSVEPASQVANVTETQAPAIETVSDPIAPPLITAPPEDDYVYSRGTGVVAPRLVSLGFVHPLVRGVETRTSTLELLISKDGTVERAKISPPSRNWEDAMLLSRAKMFQFVPAQRNGFPVRYRFVMEVDTTP